MRIGIDFHGVINKKPELFAALSQALVAAGHEIHIITGPRRDKVESHLKQFNIAYTHFFSIVEFEESKGTEILWNSDGDPFMDMGIWNRAKAEYCKRQNIDLHIDDSAEYGEYFMTPFAHFKHGDKK